MEARNEEHVALYKREMMWLRPRCFAYTSVLPTSRATRRNPSNGAPVSR